MSDGMAAGLSMIFGGRKPYDAAEFRAKSAEIKLFNRDAVSLSVKDHEKNYVNISFRQGSWAWSAISEASTRIQLVRADAESYRTQLPALADEIGEAFDKWALRHIDESRAYMGRHQSMASPMITGPSNFPVRRARKLQDWADNHYKRLQEHVTAGQKRLKRIAWPHGAPGDAIRASDPEATDKLNDKAAALIRERDRMKAINAAWRKAKRPGKDDDGAGWKRFLVNALETVEAFTEAEGKIIMAGCFKHYMADRVAVPPFESWQISNLGARIKSAQARSTHIENTRDVDLENNFKTTEGDVKVVRNGEAQRIQLIFPDKPAPATRTLLKRNGFRWSPRFMAWQRHLNSGGMIAAKAVLREIETE